MMNKTVLMLSVSCMSFIAGADLCYAGFNPYDTPPVLSAAMLKSHVSTHTSHLTAAHLSSLEDFAELTLPENSRRDREGFKPSLTLPKSLGRENRGELTKFLGREEKGEKIKLAAACFVTDTSGCSGNEFGGNNADEDDGGVPPGGDDYDLDNAERCRQEGYTQTSCPEGQEPVNTCPYDSSYFEKCVSSCPSNYVTCEVPYYGVGEDCDGKYASCEKDTERACQELNPGYVDECGTGQQLSDDRCSYDSSYGTCCNACTGYDYTNIPEGYVQDGEACTSCDGQEHYKIKPNPCDGYMDCGSMGPEIGAKSCQSGNQIKYDNCKACPNLGSLTYCPAPFTCSYEDCSGLYYKTGCQPGYDWNQSSQTCTKQCDYKCSLSSCPANAECDYESCSKKYCFKYCSGNYEESNGKCVCPADYNLSSCPTNAFCSSCEGKYSFNGCQSGWDQEGDKCVCKNKGTYTTCPTGYVCKYETCSKKYYKIDGCQSGYDEVGNECILHVHNYICKDGYQKDNLWENQALKSNTVCSCGKINTSEYCYKCPAMLTYSGNLVRTFFACTHCSLYSGKYIAYASKTEVCITKDGIEEELFSQTMAYEFDTLEECNAHCATIQKKVEDGGTCEFSRACEQN